MRRLIVMDVDSTFIENEQIDLLAQFAGTGEQVAHITHRAMSGELDFAQSLKERVATLKGLPETVLEDVQQQISFTPGAVELVDQCTERGWVVGLVSGGFHEVIDPLVAHLPIRYVRANHLEVIDGKLTGNLQGRIVDRQAKADLLRIFAETEQIPLQETVAIGDGANDLDMLASAGLGVAFQAKPVVAQQADISLPGPRLDDVLAHL